MALLFLMTLQYVPDSDDPHAIVRGYLDALVPGSFLVVSDTVMEGNAPGIVPLNRWRPGPDEPVFERDIPAVAGLARKP